jgi:peptidoglycan LD-endopeptidase CwlK
MADLNLLLPKVKQMAENFISKCNAQGIKVTITSTYRSPEEQDILYAQGRTTPGNVVTNAKGGQSIHNWKCAIDFAPVVNGVIPWNNKDLFTKIGVIGESCGFEWGGRWESFLDLPHLQYTAGYTLTDFQNGKVDYNKFNTGQPQHVSDFLQALSNFQKAENIPPAPRIGPMTSQALKRFGIM